MITVCQDCSKHEKQLYPSPTGLPLCYSCEAIFLEKEGLWIDPAGGLHSIHEENLAEIYK